MASIYLDHNASTPPAPEVVEAMMPWLGVAHANPHAEHLAGRRAAAAVDRAIQQIADLVGADADSIVLTSGATESNNLALQGLLLAPSRPFELWHSNIEHKSVLEIASHVAEAGVVVRQLPVDSLGRIRPSTLGDIRVDDSCRVRPLVSAMHANNEIGTVQPIDALARAVAEIDGLLHVDASQSCGLLQIAAQDVGIDLLSISSHKMYGPSGVGALFVSAEARRHLRPIMFGGGQQGGIRPGTVPVFLAVGFGAACELAKRRLAEDAASIERIADTFCESLNTDGVRFSLLGDPEFHLPGLRSVWLKGVDADDLVARVAPHLSLSTGSACTSGDLRASHVLRAIGMSEDDARSVIRVGFGRNSTVAEAVYAASIIAAAVREAF